ncbi:hypothetical protein HGB13_00160 [bacterium]|nr:hypothetical protein [bacterium]
MIDKKEEIVPQKPFNESLETEQEYKDNWVEFLKYQEHRNQSVRFLNKNGQDRSILDYVKDSVDRMNEYHLQPDWKSDWQNNVFDPITRNKLIAILSKIASSRMKPELFAKARSIFNTESTIERKMIFSDLLENANRHNKDEVQLIWEMYTCMSEGTVIGYESWKKDAREVEYIKSVDPDTGKVESETIKVNAWDDVFGEIVPINEFFPESIWVHDISQVKRCFRTKILSLEKFKDEYGSFKNASRVNAAGFYMTESNFDWGIVSETRADEVFVLHYYNEVKDRLKIWANGTEIYNGPMPWNHKKLPFWLAIFEPIHHQFLYGKSLPDKLMGMQDVDNALFNGMLDQLFIGLNSPIFATGEVDDIGDGFLEPSKVYHGDQDSTLSKINLGTVDATNFNMLSLIKKGMEETSISAQAQGVASGGRKTKYETQQLQEGALSLASLFLQIMESCYAQKYWLRMYNVIQYYSMPSSVESDKPQFKYIVLENRKLTNGKIGKKMIQITDNVPENAKEDLVKIAEQESGQDFDPMESRVEPIVITRDWLMNHELDLEIRIVPNSSVKESEADRKNKAIAFFGYANQNPMFDQEVISKSLAEALDQPEDSVKKPEAAGAPNPMAGLPNLGQANKPQGGEMPTELL